MDAPRLKKLAEVIRAEWPDLDVRVERGFCNTDRKVGRHRHPGKGRHGTRLIVRDLSMQPPYGGEVLLDHNSAETYRRNSEVVEWIEARRRK